MKRTRLFTASAALVAVALLTGHAMAVTNGEKCAASKLKAASKYAACRLAADAKATAKGVPADYSKCDAKQESSWAKAEAKYGVECLTTGDQVSNKDDLTNAADCVSDLLTGTPGTCSFTKLPPCPPGGVVVDDTCWVLGPIGDSCSSACALAGLLYDSKTETFAGPNGSGGIANCLWLALQLGGFPASLFGVQGPPDIGCALGSGLPYLSPTVLPQGYYSGFSRICGCS